MIHGQVMVFNLDLDDFKHLVKDCVKSEIEELKLQSDKKEEADILLSIEQVQELLGETKETIHKWKKKGLLPYHKMNRRLYFKKAEVLDSLRKISKKGGVR